MRRIARVQHQYQTAAGESKRRLTLSEIAAALQEAADATAAANKARDGGSTKGEKKETASPTKETAWSSGPNPSASAPPRHHHINTQQAPTPAPRVVSMPTSSRLQLMASLKRRAQHHYSTASQQQQGKPPTQAPTAVASEAATASSNGERGTLPSAAETTFRFLDLADLAQPPSPTKTSATTAAPFPPSSPPPSTRIHLPQYESTSTHPQTPPPPQPPAAFNNSIKEKITTESTGGGVGEHYENDDVLIRRPQQPYYKTTTLEGFQRTSQPLAEATQPPSSRQQHPTASEQGDEQSPREDQQGQAAKVDEPPKKLLFDLTSFSKYINGGADNFNNNNNNNKPETTPDIKNQSSAQAVRPLVARGNRSPPSQGYSNKPLRPSTAETARDTTATAGPPSTSNNNSSSMNSTGKVQTSPTADLQSSSPSASTTWIDEHIEKFLNECTVAAQKQQDDDSSSNGSTSSSSRRGDEGDALIRFSPDFFAALVSSNNVVKHIVFNHFPKCRQSIVSNNMDVAPGGNERSVSSKNSFSRSSTAQSTTKKWESSSSSSSRYVIGSELTNVETALHCTLALSLALHCEDVLQHQNTQRFYHQAESPTSDRPLSYPVVMDAMGTRIAISEPSHHSVEVANKNEEWDGTFNLEGGGEGDSTSTQLAVLPSSLTSFSDISECVGTMYSVFRGSLSVNSLNTLYKHALSHSSRPIVKYMASVGVVVRKQKNVEPEKEDTNLDTHEFESANAVDVKHSTTAHVSTNTAVKNDKKGSFHKFPLMFDPYSSLTFSIQRRLVASLLKEESQRRYWLRSSSWTFPASVSLSSSAPPLDGAKEIGTDISTTNGIISVGPEVLFSPAPTPIATSSSPSSESTNASSTSQPPGQPIIGAQSIANTLHNFFLAGFPDDLPFDVSWRPLSHTASSSTHTLLQPHFVRKVSAHGLMTALLVEQLNVSSKEITAYMDTLQSVTKQLKAKAAAMERSSSISSSDVSSRLLSSSSSPKKSQKFALHSSLLDFFRFPPTNPQRQCNSMDRVMSQPFYPTHYRSPLPPKDHSSSADESVNGGKSSVATTAGSSSSLLVSKHKDRRPVGAFAIVSPTNKKAAESSPPVAITYVQNFTTHPHILHCISKVWGERGVSTSLSSISSRLAQFWVKDQTSPYNITTTTTTTADNDEHTVIQDSSSPVQSIVAPSTTTITTTTTIVSTNVTLLHSMVFNVLATHYATLLQLQKFVEATRSELDDVYQQFKKEEIKAQTAAAASVLASGADDSGLATGPETQRSNPSPTLLITKRGPQEGMRVYSKLSEVTLEIIRSIPHVNQGLQLAALQEISDVEEFAAAAIGKLQLEMEKPVDTKKEEVRQVNGIESTQSSLFDSDTTASDNGTGNTRTSSSSSPHALLLHTPSLAAINSYLTSSPLLTSSRSVAVANTGLSTPSSTTTSSPNIASSIESAVAVVDSVNWSFLLMALAKNPYIHIGLLRSISPQFTLMTHLTTSLMHDAQEKFEKIALSKMREVFTNTEEEEADINTTTDVVQSNPVNIAPTHQGLTPPTITSTSNSALFSELVKLGTIETRSNKSNNDVLNGNVSGNSTYNDVRTRPFSVGTFTTPVAGNVSSRLVSVVGIIALLSRPDVNIAPPATLFRAFGNLIISASGPVLIPMSEALYRHGSTRRNIVSDKDSTAHFGKKRTQFYDAAEWNLVCTSPLRSFAVSMPPEPFRRFLVGMNLIQLRTIDEMVLAVHSESPTTTTALNTKKCVVKELWDTQLNPASHLSRISTLGSLSTVLMLDWDKLHRHGIEKTDSEDTVKVGVANRVPCLATAMTLCPAVLNSRQDIEASIADYGNSSASVPNTPLSESATTSPTTPPHVVRVLSPLLQFIHAVQSPVNHAALQWQLPLRVIYTMRQYTADAVDNYRSGKDCRHYLYTRCSDEDITPLSQQQQSSSSLKTPTILTNTPPFVGGNSHSSQSSSTPAWPALDGCTASTSGGRSASIRAMYDLVSELTYTLTLNSETFRTVDSTSPFKSIAALTAATTSTSKKDGAVAAGSNSAGAHDMVFELAPASLAAVLYAIAHISPQAIHEELSPYLPRVDPSTGNTIVSRKPIPRNLSKRLTLVQRNLSQLFSSAPWISCAGYTSSKSTVQASRNNLSLTGNNSAKLRSSDLLNGEREDNDVDVEDSASYEHTHDRDDRPLQQNSSPTSSNSENSISSSSGSGNSIFVSQFSDSKNQAIKTANRIVDIRNAVSASDELGGEASLAGEVPQNETVDDLEDELLTAAKAPSTATTPLSTSISRVQLPHVSMSTAMFLHLAATSPSTLHQQQATATALISPKTLAHKFAFYSGTTADPHPLEASSTLKNNTYDTEDDADSGSVPEIKFQCCAARTGVSMQGGGMMRHFSSRLSTNTSASSSSSGGSSLSQQQLLQLPPFWERIFGADGASREGNNLLTTTTTPTGPNSNNGGGGERGSSNKRGRYSHSSSARPEHYLLGRHSRWGKINELLRSSMRSNDNSSLDSSSSTHISIKVQEARILKLMPQLPPPPTTPSNDDHEQYNATVTSNGVLNLLCTRADGSSKGYMGSSVCMVSSDELLVRRRLQTLYKAHVSPEGLLPVPGGYDESTQQATKSSNTSKKYVLPEGPMTVPQALESLRAVEDKINAAFDMINVVLYLDMRLRAQQRNVGKSQRYQHRSPSNDPRRHI